MLVVTRKVNQKLSISGRITITVVRVGVGNVRIGIEAPPEVEIARTELLERLEAQESGMQRARR